MSRPVGKREAFDRELGQLARIRRVVETDAKARRKLWHRSVLERLNELMTLFMAEDTRRRTSR
jgi:hypothetical protein